MSARYQPGRLLARLRNEFPGFECHDLDRGAVRLSTCGTFFDVREVVETHFLMHTVIAQFELHVDAALNPAPSRVRVRHTGALTRRGIEFESSTGDSALVEALHADAELAAALLPLDFTHCELSAETTGGWRVRLRHFGASEVVGRLPALSRYVPLIAAQRESLLAAFRGFERVLARSVKFQAH